jgi:hypothetical protein
VRPRLALVIALAAAAVVVAASCIPQDRRNATEVGAADDIPAAPVFPETGQVPPDLLVEGLVYDFTRAPNDLNLWVPPTEQARCAAQKIVDNLGTRISDLGYLPGTSGASLNDIALTSFERESIASLFQSCVDMTEATASLFIGSGHMTSRQARCMAQGLADKGQTAAFARAWAFGREIDPFEEDAAFVTTLLDYTEVCLPDTAFTWFGVDLPGDEDVVEVGGGPEDPTDPDGSSSTEGTDLPSQAGLVTTTTARPTG